MYADKLLNTLKVWVEKILIHMILNFPALDFLNSKYKRVLDLRNPERENSNSCKTIYTYLR